MPLSPGERLSHYEILAEIGAGGMGSVYRGRDTRLGRDVAIKVSTEKFSERFEREARVIASLNHPNICTLYDVGPNYLVMELIEGVAPKGPLGEKRVLDYARQMVDALDYAHEKGVTHRDLKPANIKITPEGRVKLLDFGLAQQGAQTATSESSEDLPTLSMSLTEAGVIVGTAAYMSPEQAQGKRVDKRSDVWAFGVVLYEMLTGRRPFQGSTLTDVLAAVLKEAPDWGGVPPRFRALLERCLEKDPKKRLRDIGDALVLVGAGTEVPVQTKVRATGMLPWIAAAVLGLAAVWGWARSGPTAKTPQGLVRLNLDLENGAPFGYHYGPNAILSPDGTRVVFVALQADGHSRLFVRPLDQQKARELPGTEDAHSPFFSPNGQSVGFFAAGKMKRVDVDGGMPMVLADAPNPRGGSWGEDDRIVGALGLTRYLQSVPAGGGATQNTGVAQTDEFTWRWPQVLPGGKGVLFTANKAAVGFDGGNIAVIGNAGGTSKILVNGGTFGRYLPSGHLIYLRGGTLFAVGFDLEHLEVQGKTVAVLEEVAYSNLNGGAQVDISRDGSVVYTSGAGGLGKTTVQWLEAGGKTEPLLPKPGVYLWPRLSPAGDRLLVTVVEEGDSRISVYDPQRDKVTPLGDGQVSMGGVWTPDGRNVIFGSSKGLLWGRADGANKLQQLVTSDQTNHPWSLPKSGSTLAFIEQVPQAGFQIRTAGLKMEGGQLKAGAAEPFRAGRPGTTPTSYFPTLSPDGKWMAYDSNESGRFEVYVQAFPASPSASSWKISDGGGTLPVWAPNGHELFYKNLDQRIRVLTYGINGDSFVADKPRLWSEKPLADTGTFPNYDLAPDGKRIAALMPVEDPTGRNRVTFLMNFTSEIERRLQRAAAK